MKDLTKIILKPVITERSNALKEGQNRFVFEVHPRANKHEIRLAVEKLFNVTVKDVQTCVMKGKPKSTTMKGGRGRT
jgi:large subunit ribosomal protein L23